jgi:GTP pyrophosphokinase
MVAVRGAHLRTDEQFVLEDWIASLRQEPAISKKLTSVYQHIQTITEGTPDGNLLLWRGREMIEILITLSMDKSTLVAALLFPVATSGLLDRELLQEEYGKEILKMIDGVEEMAAIGQLNVTLQGSEASAQVDNVRRMLLAMVDDFRCVVIKLAERICNLREVKDHPDEIRRAAAKECANIYAPLANRLGIGQLKWEIEDYAFRYQQPETYKQIAKQLSERRIVREQYIRDFVDDLRDEMQSSNILAEVSGRPKHIYSIWRKMQKKNLAFDELFDVRAVRIIAERLQDCYAALGIVHTKYSHLPSEFDDYVANPKPNGYQSIHTVVLGPEGKTIEIQIRTKQMHEESELGVAAHWKYKEGASVGAVATTRKLHGCVSYLIGKKRCQTRAKCLMNFVAKCLMIAFTPLPRVVMWWICQWAQRHSTLRIIFTLKWDTAASELRLVGVSCRSRISCTWVIRLKLSPQKSQILLATG